MPKVLIAGFLHETNTFSPELTQLEDFQQADEWPALSRGDEIFDRFQQNNIPMSGFIHASKPLEFHLIPSVWCAAPPAGKVDQIAFDRITQMIIDDLQTHPNVDAVYCDLHGAMVTTTLDDAEGELLARIRNQVGPEVPIIVTLDFHANISEKMLENSDRMIIYRTYPHVDMFDIGEEAANTLERILSDNEHPFKMLLPADYLIPITAQCTLIEPSITLYQRIQAIEQEHDVKVELAQGFPLSDIVDAGPTFALYARNYETAMPASKALLSLFEEVKPQFQTTLYDTAAAMDYVKTHQSHKPIILADTQDNPGAGGSSDTIGLFRALVEHHIDNAIVAIVCDPNTASEAHEKGIGGTLIATIGECTASARGTPFSGAFTIEALSDGQFIGTGAYCKGCHIDLGPMAYLTHEGVGVIVSSRKMQAADQAIFHHLGLHPDTFNVIVLKSSVHFRADFMSLTDQILIVTSPGNNTADLSQLTYQKCHKAILA